MHLTQGRGGREGGREGGGREGGVNVIYIIIGMFNSNPMIPQHLRKSTFDCATPNNGT